MNLPGRHSLFWKLVGILLLFCLIVVSINVDVSRWLYDASSKLPLEAKALLRDYGQQAEQRWRTQGSLGVDAFLQELQTREGIWAVVVGEDRQSLSSTALTAGDKLRLNFIRRLDGKLGRPGGNPVFYVPFSNDAGLLVLELPSQINPRKYHSLWVFLLQRVLPSLLAIVLGFLLYRIFIAPLAILHRQALALSEGVLDTRVGEPVSQRRDELGELARAFDYMAQRLESTVTFQRNLLQELSHELRTPLSRLRVAHEQQLDSAALFQRLERELDGMETLIRSILELAWLDTERPALPLDKIEVVPLWALLREDAGFEMNWPAQQMPCDLPADCCVQGNLNALAQVLENILRNAIRHSPENGEVRLSGYREDDWWYLSIQDQGPGVAEPLLEEIFRPFARLGQRSPGQDGFGLGLSIARAMVQLQGGQLWAENAEPGLRLVIKLRSG